MNLRVYNEEQNIYLDGILKREETKKKTRGHARKAHPPISAKGNKLEGHQPKIVVLHTSISSGMEKLI